MGVLIRLTILNNGLYVRQGSCLVFMWVTLLSCSNSITAEVIYTVILWQGISLLSLPLAFTLKGQKTIEMVFYNPYRTCVLLLWEDLGRRLGVFILKPVSNRSLVGVEVDVVNKGRKISVLEYGWQQGVWEFKKRRKESAASRRTGLGIAQTKKIWFGE